MTLMTEQELLVDCLVRLNRIGVKYMLTGSMASNYWGVPRTTHDLDFVVRFPLTDVPSIVAAFQADFFIHEPSVRAAFEPPFQFNAIDTRSALKIDFWLLGEDPFEQEVFVRRTPLTLFGTPAWIATAEDVILHKLYWHSITPSDRQLHDAAGVAAVQAGLLHVSYLRRWAGHLSVSTLLEDVLAGRIRVKST
jgi:hypothetical protein